MTHDAQGGGLLMPRARSFDHEEAMRLADGGMSYEAIAKQFGVSGKSVGSAIKRARDRGAASGIVFPNDPAIAPPRPVALVPPATPVKCTHTGCQDQATATLTHGTFLHHLALDRGGTKALDLRGAPVCHECFHVATGGFPCQHRRCTRVARIEGGFCTEHMPVMASPPPTAAEQSPFPCGPFPGPQPRATSPREIDATERRRLAQLASATERRTNGDLPIGTPRPKDTTMRNGTPGPTAAEREMSTIPSDISARVAEVLEQQVSDDPGDPGQTHQLDENGERVGEATESQITEPTPQLTSDDTLRTLRSIAGGYPLGERIAAAAASMESSRVYLTGAIADPTFTPARVRVERQAGDWHVQLDNAYVDLDVVVPGPEWGAVERLLATFIPAGK